MVKVTTKIIFGSEEAVQERLAASPVSQTINRTSRTHSHKPLNLLVISFMEHIALKLTFRTLFRPSEAIFEEPPVEGGAGATYRLFHAL